MLKPKSEDDLFAECMAAIEDLRTEENLPQVEVLITKVGALFGYAQSRQRIVAEISNIIFPERTK